MERFDLKAVLNAYGLNLSKAAERVGVDKATMTRWAQDKIPAERVVEVERALGIPRRKLRPDFFVRAAE